MSLFVVCCSLIVVCRVLRVYWYSPIVVYGLGCGCVVLFVVCCLWFGVEFR